LMKEATMFAGHNTDDSEDEGEEHEEGETELTPGACYMVDGELVVETVENLVEQAEREEREQIEDEENETTDLDNKNDGLFAESEFEFDDD